MNDSLILRDLVQAKKSLKNAIKKLKIAGKLNDAIRLKHAVTSIDRAILTVRSSGDEK